jgi:hypothetical protein
LAIVSLSLFRFIHCSFILAREAGTSTTGSSHTDCFHFFRFGGGRLLHGVHLFPSHSWSAKSRFLVSLVPSWRISCLHLGVHPFKVPRTTVLGTNFPNGIFHLPCHSCTMGRPSSRSD